MHDDTEAGNRGFPTTAWPDIVRAGGAYGEAARRTLGQLIRRYWHPVYFFIRHKGRSREEAKDLTQGFFAFLVDKNVVSYADRNRGKFRSLILASVTQYLALQHRRDSRHRRSELRGELDPDLEAWQGFEPTRSEDPEATFMRNWAKRLVENCVERLHEECREEGKEVRFRVFRARFLDVERSDAKTTAKELGISVDDVANHLSWGKRRFKRILRHEVQEQVASPEQADEEIVELLGVLTS
jgi:RNA polymerase sigma-70 factor (ECF subfamily)